MPSLINLYTFNGEAIPHPIHFTAQGVMVLGVNHYPVGAGSFGNKTECVTAGIVPTLAPGSIWCTVPELIFPAGYILGLASTSVLSKAFAAIT